MKHRFVFSFILFFLGTLAFSAPKVPKWISDPKLVYPDEKYLARTGHGLNEDAARANALSVIAGYFKTQVATSIKGTSKMTDNDGNVSKQRAIEQETLVETQMDLIAVDYSETYFDKKNGEYYSCAFIDREVAWSVIEPNINKYMNKYESLYDKALAEKEQILRYKYLYKSRAAGEELVNHLYFGFLIYLAKRTEFQEKIQEISTDAVFGALDEQTIPLYLEVKGDQDGILTSEVTKIFSSFGFTVSTKKADSQSYKLSAYADANEQWSGEGDMKMVAVFPSVELLLSNIKTGEELYTWKNTYGRTSNFTVENAMRRTFKNVIIPDIKNTVPTDYRTKLMAD